MPSLIKNKNSANSLRKKSRQAPRRKTVATSARKTAPGKATPKKAIEKKSSRQQPRVQSKSQAASESASSAAWEKIYAAIERIPRGSVATYGGIAEVAGLPRRARLVGTALRNVSRTRKLPWYRVLTASGRFAFPPGSDAYRKQQQNLQREGVLLQKGRVNLRKHGWPHEVRELDEVLWRMA